MDCQKLSNVWVWQLTTVSPALQRQEGCCQLEASLRNSEIPFPKANSNKGRKFRGWRDTEGLEFKSWKDTKSWFQASDCKFVTVPRPAGSLSACLSHQNK